MRRRGFEIAKGWENKILICQLERQNSQLVMI